jgi:hypothetical protein
VTVTHLVLEDAGLDGVIGGAAHVHVHKVVGLEGRLMSLAMAVAAAVVAAVLLAAARVGGG